jgi:hypothetical protein
MAFHRFAVPLCVFNLVSKTVEVEKERVDSIRPRPVRFDTILRSSESMMRVYENSELGCASSKCVNEKHD